MDSDGVIELGGTEVGSLPSHINLGSLNGQIGYRFHGIDMGEASGNAVSSAGDVNGDGFDDLLIGAPGTDRNSTMISENIGRGYLVFGGLENLRSLDLRDGMEGLINLDALLGAPMLQIQGIHPQGGFGSSLAAGDINGDGLSDLVIGSPFENGFSGAAYVVFGRRSPADSFPAVNLRFLDGNNGVRLFVPTRDLVGFSVASGDINGDGVDDIVMGAPLAAGGIGATYVVFGTDTDLDNDGDSDMPFATSSIHLGQLDGANGFAVIGGETNASGGFSVASSGEVNGDGIDDLLIGAPNGDVARAYVVFGARQSTASVEITDLSFATILHIAFCPSTTHVMVSVY